MITVLHIVIIIALCSIAYIDFRQLIIPDTLSLLIAVSAILILLVTESPAVEDALFGAFFALLLFEGTRRIMAWRLHREALGFGDVKLMTAGALWIGLSHLPLAVLTACLSALIAFAILWRVNGLGIQDRQIPFAPFIALGLIVAKSAAEFGL